MEWAGMHLEADTLLKEQKSTGWFILVSNDTRVVYRFFCKIESGVKAQM